jgi:hypothetical protein
MKSKTLMNRKKGNNLCLKYVFRIRGRLEGERIEFKLRGVKKKFCLKISRGNNFGKGGDW